MVENFKIVETDAPYMKASSFYNSILKDIKPTSDEKEEINNIFKLFSHTVVDSSINLNCK